MVDLRATKSGLLAPAQALAINADAATLARFVAGLPKAELHLHVEGTLEPELMLAIARRNGVALEGSEDAEAFVAAQRAKRNFSDLQSFLDLYYAGCDVMRTEQDFYDVCSAYLERARKGGVVRAEIFFDPQTHLVERNALPLKTVVDGLHRACADSPVDAALIMCFLRHRRDAGEAMAILDEALANHRHQIVGVGLDSSEAGNPPRLFAELFAKARGAGLRCVAHAGEEGPAAYVTEALDLLRVERVDHGVRCLEDPALVSRLMTSGTPLTVCPCSNHRLQVTRRFFSGENATRQLLDKGLKVTLNSDDPAYFFGHIDKFGLEHGGYIESSYLACARECGLSADELVILARNSLEASFASPAELDGYLALLKE
eukprot:CAMPEP_0119280424 /NCGR_PEP_ID=MMETSP1329-20130426/22620_1 /TAXON_ID=114041 /ORGANISM="Genus nov. species nov., Strain RCC1024" /LENGTH=373 /DNA_ID=CAMNT_0007281011 /DNA_START=175 /DNA_END=1293 /DNA_ORIENTATION=+